jgi:hypothetical protein
MEQLYHTPDKKKEWNERYYFNFYDPHHETGGFTRIGFKPNIKEGIGYLFLFYKKEILAFHQRVEGEDVPEIIRTGLLRFTPAWRVTLEAPMKAMDSTTTRVTLDLMYTPLNTEFSYLDCVSTQEFDIGRVVCEDHYEQMGIMEGEITIDSHTYPISGFSERDHSWGERDWNTPHLWIYMTAHFNRDFGINIATMKIDQTQIDVGFIMDQGKNIPVTKIYEDTISKGKRQKSFEYTVEDAKGNSYVMTGTVLKTVQIPYERGGNLSILNENLSQFTCGDRTGYGTAEYLVRIK